MSRVVFDPALCVGHGRCYVLAPEVFGEDDRGHCVPHRSEVEGELADKARIAEQNCPESAIRVED